MSGFGFDRVVLDVLGDVRGWLDDDLPAV
jgi:hypothetical protein